MKLIKFAGVTEAIRFDKVVADVRRLGVFDIEAFAPINVIHGRCSRGVFKRLMMMSDIAIAEATGV